MKKVRCNNIGLFNLETQYIIFYIFDIYLYILYIYIYILKWANFAATTKSTKSKGIHLAMIKMFIISEVMLKACNLKAAYKLLHAKVKTTLIKGQKHS